jgi:hypothetical protein
LPNSQAEQPIRGSFYLPQWSLRDNAELTSQPSMTPATVHKHFEYDLAANLLTAGAYYSFCAASTFREWLGRQFLLPES